MHKRITLCRVQEDNVFKTNIGSWDKILRIVVGVGLLALGAFGPIGRWGLIGLIPLLTGVVGSCSLYTLFGMSTGPSRKITA